MVCVLYFFVIVGVVYVLVCLKWVGYVYVGCIVENVGCVCECCVCGWCELCGGVWVEVEYC